MNNKELIFKNLRKTFPNFNKTIYSLLDTYTNLKSEYFNNTSDDFFNKLKFESNIFYENEIQKIHSLEEEYQKILRAQQKSRISEEILDYEKFAKQLPEIEEFLSQKTGSNFD